MAAALITLMIWVALRPESAHQISTGYAAPAIIASPASAARDWVGAPGPPEIATSEPPVPQSPQPEQPRAAGGRDIGNPQVPGSIPRLSPAGFLMDSATVIDLDKISLMFRDYRTLAGENPVGTNAEIMKAIMGGNPKGAMLGPPEGQSLNSNGELIDHWGSPYFFHQLSKDLMEIHSAGPDRRMGNGDDLIGD